MLSWRITKYNPKHRNSVGAYLIKDEWTSYSEIGDTFNDKKFTYEEYKTVEDAYISSIILFMECNNLETLNITNLEKPLALDKKDKYLSKNMKDVFNFTENGLSIDRKNVDIVSRLILREKLWCKLEAKDMFVHFGWDYYMYIGSAKKCEKYIQKIQALGLFVEEYASQYLD